MITSIQNNKYDPAMVRIIERRGGVFVMTRHDTLECFRTQRLSGFCCL